MGDAIAQGVVTDPLVTSSPATQKITSGSIVGPPGGAVTPPIAPGEGALAYEKTDFNSNPETVSGNGRFDQWWKPDGSLAMTCRDNSDRIDAYDVSPAWSITPGDWSNRKTATGIGSPSSLYITPDGKKAIWLNLVSSRSFIQATMSTPFDPSTLGAQTSKFLGTSDLNARWADDGLTVWTIRIGFFREYSVGTAFDVLTINTLPVSTFDTEPDAGTPGPTTMAWSADGTKIYACMNQSQKNLVSWDASTPFDITTLGGFEKGLDMNAPAATEAMLVIRGMFYRPDNGDIHVVQDQNQQRMKVFSPIPDPDITEYSFTSTGVFTIAGNNHLTPWFNLAGDRVYFSRSTSWETWQYSMSTPGDMSTIAFELTHDWSFSSGVQRGIALNPDRSKFYKIRRTTGSADSFVSADPFSVTEVGDVAGGNPYTLTGLSGLGGIGTPTTPTSFVIAANNLDIFVQSADVGDRAIYHYLMSVAGDAGTATSQGQALDVSGEFDTNLFGMIYTPDGSKLFVVGTNSSAVIIAQYDLSTAYDVNTASYSGKQITVTPLSTVLLGLFVWENPAGGFQLNLTWPVGGASNGSAWAFDQYDAP